MVNQELLNFIDQHLKQGTAREQIKATLLANGWKQRDVDDAFASLNISNQNPTDTKIISPSSHKPIVAIASFLGILIIAGVIYLGYSTNKRSIVEDHAVNRESAEIVDSDQETSAGFFDGQSYRNESFGISFKLPEGFSPMKEEASVLFPENPSLRKRQFLVSFQGPAHTLEFSINPNSVGLEGGVPTSQKSLVIGDSVYDANFIYFDTGVFVFLARTAIHDSAENVYNFWYRCGEGKCSEDDKKVLENMIASFRTSDSKYEESQLVTLSKSAWVAKGLSGANDYLSIEHPPTCIDDAAQSYASVTCLNGALVLRQYELSSNSLKEAVATVLEEDGTRGNETGLDGSSFPDELLGNAKMEVRYVNEGIFVKPTAYLRGKDILGIGEVLVVDINTPSTVYDFRYKATTPEARALLWAMLQTLRINR